MKIRLFSSRLLISFTAFLLFASSELPSSSKAEDGFWLARSQSGLERLWSGVLGCADATPSTPYTRNRLEDDDGEASVPTGTSNDYSHCGKLALRNTGSRILVDTIEDAVRSGGVALFSDNFRLDSSVDWVFGEKVSGEFDAVIPLFSRERFNGKGYAFFLQPGAVFWQGLKEQERIDANLGLAYRAHLTQDVVAGGSVFYDYDFKREHQRAGVGLDLQSGALHTALNYYHPLNEWQEGRTDYEEQPLQGADFRLGLAWSRIRFDTSIGVWRFEREEEEKTKWRPAFGIDAGYRILPGVFLEGGYESHDSDDSLDSRWNAGLAFRFSLPGLQGVKSYETMAAANLWEPVAREKRILYEEREAIPRVRLVARDSDGAEFDANTPIVEPSGDSTGVTVTIAGELDPVPEAVTYELVVDEISTAVLGADFNYGHRVYELDAETGEQSAPDTATSCPEATCEMTIPAEVTRFDIELEVLNETEKEPELREEIVLRVDVPEEHQRTNRSNTTALMIEANNNVVMLDADGSDTDLREADDPATSEAEDTATVTVGINLPSPTPITLNVAPSGTATEGTDYTISTRSLTIPANADSASLTLTGIDNDRGEGSKEIILTLEGDLPEGWDFGPATDPANPPDTITHTLTLQDDDLAIFFTSATSSRVDEPGTGNADVTVAVGITQAPTANITVRVAAGGSGESATAGSSMDYTFTGMDFTFTPTDHADRTATFSVHSDTTAELDETIVLTIADMGTRAAREEDGFSLGSPHTVTIPANDNTVEFTEATSTLDENGGTVDVAVNANLASPSPIRLNVSAASTDAVEGEDYTVSSGSLTIPANANGEIASASLRLTGINNDRGEGSKTITLTIPDQSLPSGWTLGSQTTHTVTLRDDDLSIFFVTSGTGAIPGSVAEPASGGTPVTVTVGITQAPTADITVRVASKGTGETAAEGSGMDYTFTATDIKFTSTGSLEQTATLMVLADTAAELDETIVLTLADDAANSRMSEGSGFSLGGNHTITIPANDNTAGFASGTSTLTEGANTMMDVTVNINQPAAESITLNVVTSGTAIENTDYAIDSKSLTINAGESSGTFTLRGRDDSDGEGDETVILTLSAAGTLPTGWTLGTATHTVTIKDDDLSIFFVTSGTGAIPSSVTEPATDQSVTVTVGITQAPMADITVRVAAGGTGETATSGTGNDYTFTATDLTFPMGDTTSQTATLMVLADATAEGDETIVLTLADDAANSRMSEGSGFSLGADHTITIPVNDSTVGFRVATSTLTEGTGTTTEIEMATNRGADENITLDFVVVGTTDTDAATENTDYTIDSKSLTINAGESSGKITLTGREDNAVEGNETIKIEVRESASSPLPDGWSFGGRITTHTVTLHDNDLSISFADATPSMVEEPASHRTITVTVGINYAPTADITVRVAAGGSGETATSGTGNDYTFTATDLTFPMGSTASQTATLTVRADQAAEPDETIVLTLAEVSNSLTNEGSGFTLGGNHTITIPANDGVVRFAESTSSFTEGAGTMREVEVEVVPPATENITLNVAVSGTATKNTDYTIDSESLTINAGESSGKITLTGMDDSVEEGNETIVLQISLPSGSSLPSGWTLGTAMHTVTLHDNDGLSISFADAVMSMVEEPDSGATSVTITVDISSPPMADIKVMVAAGGSGETATSGTGNDYTFPATELTFPSGSTTSQTATLMVLADDDPEGDETIVLTLADDSTNSRTSEGSGFTLGGSHTITIPANDTRTIRITESSTRTEGRSVLQFITVGISSRYSQDVVLGVRAAAASTADVNDDYMPLPQTVTIPANNDGGRVNVSIIDDGDDEPVETLILEIFEPSGANAWPEGIVLSEENTRHTLSILDDDVPDNTIGFNLDISETAATEGAGEFDEGNALATLEIAENLPSDTEVTVTITGVSDASGFTFYRQVPFSGPQALPSNVITIPMGDRTFPFNLTAPEDADSNDETITLTLSGTLPAGWSFGSKYSPATWTITVDDDD